VGAGPGNQGGALTLAAEKSITLGGATTGNKSQSPVRISVGKDGTVYITGSKNINLNAAGDISLIAGGKIGLSAPNIDQKASTAMNVKADKYKLYATSELHVKSDAVLKAGGSPFIASGSLIGTWAGSGAPPDPASPQITDYSPQEKDAVSTTAPKDTVA
jgi:hypothetical protein